MQSKSAWPYSLTLLLFSIHINLSTAVAIYPDYPTFTEEMQRALQAMDASYSADYGAATGAASCEMLIADLESAENQSEIDCDLSEMNLSDEERARVEEWRQRMTEELNAGKPLYSQGINLHFQAMELIAAGFESYRDEQYGDAINHFQSSITLNIDAINRFNQSNNHLWEAWQCFLDIRFVCKSEGMNSIVEDEGTPSDDGDYIEATENYESSMINEM